MENHHNNGDADLERMIKVAVVPGYTLIRFNDLFDEKKEIPRGTAYALACFWEASKIGTYAGLGYVTYMMANFISQ